MEKIPLPTVRRLPAYLQILRTEQSRKKEWTSTTMLSESLRLKAIQVRKDMSYASCQGRPKKGFNTSECIRRIEHILGLANDCEAVLIGVGSLGSALLKYDGFSRYDMYVGAAFDSSPFLIGTTVGGVKVHDVDSLETYIRRTAVSYAILTVPESGAQEIAERLIASGIRGILNFSSAYLKTPEHITVRRDDLALSLVQLKAEVKFHQKPNAPVPRPARQNT